MCGEGIDKEDCRIWIPADELKRTGQTTRPLDEAIMKILGIRHADNCLRYNSATAALKSCR